MTEKKYFWLKMPRDFFTKPYAKRILAKENGKELLLFYIALLTESIDHDGKLRYSQETPYTEESLAEVTGFPLHIVTSALQLFTELEIVVTESDGTIFLPKSLKMIGSESSSAERVRRFRNNQKTEENVLCNTSVTQCNAEKQNCNTEIEIEKDIDIENKRIMSDSKNSHSDEVKEIIEYLNNHACTKYKHTSQKSKICINARFNDGYTIDDFKTVIDKKCAEWMDTDMEKFLRPETLFGTKFESYLNQRIGAKKAVTGNGNPIDWNNV